MNALDMDFAADLRAAEEAARKAARKAATEASDLAVFGDDPSTAWETGMAEALADPTLTVGYKSAEDILYSATLVELGERSPAAVAWWRGAAAGALLAEALRR